MARTSTAAARPLTEHEEIRAWAEERGAKPACVRRTGGKDDVGMIRLDFPGYRSEGSLQPIGWDEWFQKFDESNLALLVQDHTAGGEQSNFNKLVSRDTAEVGSPKSSSRSSSSRSSRRQAGSIYSRTEGGEEELDEDESTERGGSDLGEEADLEEDELESVETRDRDGGEISQRRKRPSRTNGQERARSAASGRQTAHGRNKRSAPRATSTRSRPARGQKTAAKKSAKKRPARSQTKSGRSSSRRRAA
jgi:hypothetical protein